MTTLRSSSPMSTGLSMLVPAPYDPSWTRIDDGTFNDYPPGADGLPYVSDPGVTPSPAGILPDASFAVSVPIPAGTPINAALVPANLRRTFLLIQNNSTATGAGNTAPNLYIAYDGPVSTTLPNGLNLTIPPGQGVIFDRRCPANAIYVLYAGGAGTFVAQGVLHQGLLPTQ